MDTRTSRATTVARNTTVAHRRHTTVRLSQAGIKAAEQLAVETGTDRSAVIRALLGEALRDQDLVRRVRARLTQPRD